MSEWARTVKLGKRDASEPGVVDAFETAGDAVVKHSGKDEPDLFVRVAGHWHPAETKTGLGRLSEGQLRWWREVAKQEPVVIRTPPQARRWRKVWAEQAASLSSLLRAQRDEAGGGVDQATEDHEALAAERARVDPEAT